MPEKRKICVVTGTRAEYGLLRWLIQEIDDSDSTELLLFVTGSHLEADFGNTYKEIENDGFKIDKKIPLFIEQDNTFQVVKSMATALTSFSSAFEEIRPDLVVLLGDRYEIFAVAQAALIAQIPVAHIHGGERTEGAIDEAIRHAITKMSHLHFASCEEYRNRIIQLGEQPNHVWNTGSIALDNFEKIELIRRSDLLTEFGLQERKNLLLCTLHPETLSGQPMNEFSRPLLNVLSDMDDSNIIFTLGNADAGGKTLNQLIENFASKFPERVFVTRSLGQVRYISALHAADLVIGNSSSGIVEAPSAGSVVVNIGNRQQGRLRSRAIMDVSNSELEIHKAIQQGLSSEMQRVASEKISPFGAPGASGKIFKIISQVPLNNLVVKQFYDIH